MNMVYLPFSDDVRQPEADSSFTGRAHPRADKQQVEAAEKLLAALSLPEFLSSTIPNPTLQRHYQVWYQQVLDSQAACCQSFSQAALICVPV